MANDLPPSSLEPNLWRPNRQLSKSMEWLVKGLFGFFALISIGTTVGIVYTLIAETVAFFQAVPLWRFLTETQWTPRFTDPQFGILVLISGTALTSLIAILVALPLGLLAAICLSEYASPRVRSWLKPALELLAGVPTVVYGYFALLFVTPLIKAVIPQTQVFNALSAGLVMGIAILPLVASLSEDAIYSVPRGLREGAYALGATRREAIIGTVLPAALSGIVASFILAASRAIGETMIVAIAAGQQPTLAINPLTSVMTMTTYIVQASLGDTPAGSLAYRTLYSVGMTLFVLTLALNILSFWFVRRFQEKYE
jgi:phosphate transport system permease protein